MVNRHTPWSVGSIGARCVMGVGIFTFGMAWGARTTHVYIPTSASVPFGLYRATRVPRWDTLRDHLVLLCLPQTVGRWAHGRGYIGVGSCVGGVSPLGKMVVGVPGDTVRVTAAGVTVNGAQIPNSRPLRIDTQRRQLPQQSDTIQILAPGTIWLASPHHARGFDSRYFGAVPSNAIREVLEPLWTR